MKVRALAAVVILFGGLLAFNSPAGAWAADWTSPQWSGFGYICKSKKTIADTVYPNNYPQNNPNWPHGTLHWDSSTGPHVRKTHYAGQWYACGFMNEGGVQKLFVLNYFNEVDGYTSGRLVSGGGGPYLYPGSELVRSIIN